MSTSHPPAEDAQSPTVRLPQAEGPRKDSTSSSDVTLPAPGNPPSSSSGITLPAVAEPAGAGSPRTLRHYVLLRELGRGGMGIVYEAEDTVLHRRVALKVLPPAVAGDASLLARFRRESEAAARLDHPGIVKVFGIGEDQDVPFYVMEFVEGKPLDRALLAGRPGFADAARVARQVADALAYAHGRGVIHRDIKPANLLVVGALGSDRPEEVRVVITDFGLARCADGAALTRTGDVLGTPAYMSPEQAGGGRDIDARADLYSLGATLYEMATGRQPFTGATTGEMLHRILDEDPPSPRGVDPRIPRDLETIIVKLMEKEPGRRYARAEEASEDLRRFLAEEPIQARPISFAGRLYRRARKNKAATALVAILVLAATAGPAVWAGARWRRARELDRQVEEAERSLLAGDPQRAFELANAAIASGADHPRARLVLSEADRRRREQEDLARARTKIAQVGTLRARADERWKHVLALHLEAVAEADRDEAKMKELLARSRKEERAARADYAKVLAACQEALAVAPSLTDAADEAAEIYLAYHRRAEDLGAWDDALDLDVFLKGLLPRCGVDARARIGPYLAGTGRVTVETDPPARLLYSRVEDRDGKLLPVPQGDWPGGEVRLDMGSWLVVATAEGYAETRIPIWVPRQGEVHVRVLLRTQAEIGERFVYIPGGGFWMGGDEKAFGSGPRRWVEVPDFAISRFEVTAAEYLEFVKDLTAREGWETAQFKVPRPSGEAGVYWKPDEDGELALPQRWAPGIPICAISQLDAIEYCRWLSARGGATYRLPMEAEWEKAARGVDGRPYPWGDEMADGRCVCRTHPAILSNPVMQLVGLAADDESPYGVRDMAGGVSEFTASSDPKDEELTVRRGAAWGFEAETCRIASRIGTHKKSVTVQTGFRLVRELVR